MPAWRQPYLPVARGCLRRQRGQALVFGIFLLMAGLAGLYFLFNAGQLTAEKTRLVTTADAVAHGADVMQARALNFDAYANRALVANEVLVAQMVSLSSWAQYAQTHADNLVWQFPECAEPYGYGAAFGAAFRCQHATRQPGCQRRQRRHAARSDYHARARAGSDSRGRCYGPGAATGRQCRRVASAAGSPASGSRLPINHGRFRQQGKVQCWTWSYSIATAAGACCRCRTKASSARVRRTRSGSTAGG